MVGTENTMHVPNTGRSTRSHGSSAMIIVPSLRNHCGDRAVKKAD